MGDPASSITFLFLDGWVPATNAQGLLPEATVHYSDRQVKAVDSEWKRYTDLGRTSGYPRVEYAHHTWRIPKGQFLTTGGNISMRSPYSKESRGRIDDSHQFRRAMVTAGETILEGIR